MTREKLNALVLAPVLEFVLRALVHVLLAHVLVLVLVHLVRCLPRRRTPRNRPLTAEGQGLGQQPESPQGQRVGGTRVAAGGARAAGGTEADDGTKAGVVTKIRGLLCEEGMLGRGRGRLASYERGIPLPTRQQPGKA